MAEPWSTTFVIRIPAERCPFCGAVDRVKVRTGRTDDGKPTKHCVCKKCSRRYRVVIDEELSARIGNDQPQFLELCDKEYTSQFTQRS